MRPFAGLVEALVCAAKFITSGISRNEAKLVVEFIENPAITGGGDAFCNSQAEVAMIEGRLHRIIELEQRPVHIAAREHEAQSFLGLSHSVNLKSWPDLS